ncbi:MAG: HAD family hydrolase [Pseudomonadota bacterium]
MTDSSQNAIRLVVSDVDGTLVTHDKRVTPATRAAVARLAELGIGFTVVSSRPPFGLRKLIADVGLQLPFGGYNGGAIAKPDLTEIESHFIDEDVARATIEGLTEAGVGIWFFASGRWLVLDGAGDYVDHERHTIATDPTVVSDFEAHIGRAGKIVGVSKDFDRLAQCEGDLAQALGNRASVARSQAYYLDIGPAGINKGTFVASLSRIMGIPTSEMAIFGDRENDIPMLKAGGLAIAMGNASPSAKSAAHHVTLSNEEDGVAAAVERFILPQAS